VLASASDPEERTESDVLTVWTSGAAGDQNPISTVNGEDCVMVYALDKILGEATVRPSGYCMRSA
jgi:hypothetical protein